MSTTDWRNRAWTEIVGRLADDRLAVYNALSVWGPCTTRQLAKLMQMDILSVRPRVTELCQMGFAREITVPEYQRQQDQSNREGYYIAVKIGEAEHTHRYGAGANAVQTEMRMEV